jgi:hypothetical protein
VCLCVVNAVSLDFFKVCDMYRDGFISNVELFLVVKMMVGNNLKVRLVPVRTDYLPQDIVKQMTLEDLRLF